jgi:hypothetical protein
MHATTARRDLVASTSLVHDLGEDLSRSQHECRQRLRRDPEHTWRRLRGKEIGIVRNAPERPPQATRSVDQCGALMRPPTLSPASHLENRDHRRSHDRGQHQRASRASAGVVPHCGEPDSHPRNRFAERRHPGAFPVGRDYASHSFAHGMSSTDGGLIVRLSLLAGAVPIRPAFAISGNPRDL